MNKKITLLNIELCEGKCKVCNQFSEEIILNTETCVVCKVVDDYSEELINKLIKS